MKNKFSKKWNKSIQARKQVKYRANAPLHIKGKFLNSHLSKELRTKYQTRSVRVKTGDKVKVMRGSYKGEEQKVERINIKTEKIYLEKIEVAKKDGSKAKKPFFASNLLIITLETNDKKRMYKLESKNKTETNKETKGEN